MNCDDARSLLVGMAHRDSSEEPAVREHLASCAECRDAQGRSIPLIALLGSVGRRDADREARRPESEGVHPGVAQALREGWASDPEPAVVSPPPRTSARLWRLAGICVAVAALIAIPLRPSGRPAESPVRHRPLAGPVRVAEVADRDRLLAGPVRVEVQPERLSVLEVEGSRIEARGPAAYVARLWPSWETFESGADAETRAWASRTGLVLAAWPILDVAAVSGLVTVEHKGERATATAGEVIFIPPNRFPVLREWR